MEFYTKFSVELHGIPWSYFTRDLLRKTNLFTIWRFIVYIGSDHCTGKQAFSQVGVQESYGRPLFREN